MLKTAQETVAAARELSPEPKPRDSPDRAPYRPADQDGNSESEDEFGPAVPKDLASRRSGPTIPRMDDLALRNEERDEERARNRNDYADDIRYERKTERKAQKDRLEELVPRADPGSRERQLEKKREVTTTLKDFRDAKEGGDVEIRDSDLMGGDDGVDAYKRQKTNMERKKSEREIRKEEIMRARAEEREEKLAERRAKEAQTMDYLKQIARDRFG